jgi:Domain of unknown function DUF11
MPHTILKKLLGLSLPIGLALLGATDAMAQLQCTAPLAAVLQSGPTGTLTLAAPTATPAATFVRATPTNLVLNGDFETFTNLALLQGPFSATLADPSAIPGPLGTNPQRAWARNTTTVPNWTVGGGNANTYTWHGRNSVLLGTPKSAAPGVGALGGYIYLGMSGQDLLAGGLPYTAPYPASAQGRITPPGVVTIKIPNTAFQANQSGGPAFIQQTVNLTVGRQYRMTYYVAAENLLNASTYSSVNGIMALDISGYAREYLTVHGNSNPLTNAGANGLYYTVEFTAKQAATTVSFINFGHAATVTGSNAAALAAEASIDDVIINACAISVSGNVFNDTNALTDNLVNGAGTNGGSASLKAYLVNSANQVVGTATVSVGGTYTFANVTPATTYTVVLSNTTTAIALGATPPAPSLPLTYDNTGESNAAPTVPGSDGTINGISAPFSVVATNVIDINFGIGQVILPPNPNGTNTCNAGSYTVLRSLLPGQNVSLVTGGGFLDRTAPNNIVTNGSLENPANATAVAGAGGWTTNLVGWTASGGGVSSYKQFIHPADNFFTVNMEGIQAFYFGNLVITAAVPPLPVAPSAGGYWNLPTTQSLTPSVGYGTPATPVALQQTLATVAGTRYRLSFANGYEHRNAGGSQFTTPSLFGVQIGAYPYVYLAGGPGQPATHILEFVATSTSTIIKFSNWGHINFNNPSATELVMDDVIVNACPPLPSVSGNVFNDTNGLVDTFVNGTGTNAASPALTAYLVNSANQVINYATISPGGTYTFANVTPATSYTVVLSNAAGTTASLGIAPPAASLPAGWVNTGENNAAPAVAGNDGVVNGVSAPFAVVAINVVNINFGIEQPPVAGTATYTAQSNAGGTVTVTVDVGAFIGPLPIGVTGSSATDATTITNIKITAFPANATTITINGTTYTSGTFPAGGITLTLAQLIGMSVDPTAGAVTVTIPYIAIDAAGQQSAPGAVVLPFGGGTANLGVTKTNGTTTLVAGSTTSYTLTFSNLGPSLADGAVVKDVTSPGLACTAISACSSTGGASCPASLPAGFTSLTSLAGLAITSFPANSTVVLTIVCNVTATGQ